MSGEILIIFLNDEYERRKSARPHYSYRAYAESLNTDVSTLIQILKGKRRLSFDKAVDYLNLLQVPLDRRNALLLSFADPSQYTGVGEVDHELTPEEAGNFRNWESFAAICSLDVEGFEKTPEGVAERIGGDVEKVRKALEVSAQLGLINFDGKHYLPSGKNMNTIPHPDGAILENQRQFNALGYERLMSDDHDDTDFSGIIVSCSRAKLQEARRRIKDFRRALAEFLSDGPKDEIYRINVQMFSVRPTRSDQGQD